MPKQLFITGIDTDAGKTYVSEGLLKLFKKNNLRTLGLKPISAGCIETPSGRRNDDALILQKASTLQLPYHEHNFIALSKPIAPHIAAQDENMTLSVELLEIKYHSILQKIKNDVDMILLEGAGGWLVPLNQHETMADFVNTIHCPVILVVGMKLGCLNHTLLTIEALKNQNITLLGWIANCIDPNMESLSANIDTLKDRIKAPLFGVVPFGAPAENHINFNLFFKI